MGTDCTLFARKARRAIYLDRLYYWNPDDLTAGSIYDKLRGNARGDGNATAEELKSLCHTLIAEEAQATAEGANPERNQKSWLWEICIRFADEHPDDEFFISADSDWVSSFDIDDKYLVWDPYGRSELAPWHPGYVEPPPPSPPPPRSAEEQAEYHSALQTLVRALESGPVIPPGELLKQAQLKVESLDVVMRCVTYTMPSEPRTWLDTLRWINRHWLKLFTDGPRSFWWNARNRTLPLKFTRSQEQIIDEFAKQLAADVDASVLASIKSG